MEGTQQEQVFEVLCILHIHALEDVIYYVINQMIPTAVHGFAYLTGCELTIHIH